MNKQPSLKFKFFADCIPVKGYVRSAIYDLNRGFYKYIPNSMIDFINDATGKNRTEINQSYDLEYQEVVNDYINFLEKNEFICWLPEALLEHFVPLDFGYDFPAVITNAILDIDNQSKYAIRSVLNQLEELGCKSAQIRSFSANSIEFFDTILKEFATSSYLSIEIITMFSSDFKESEIDEFITSHLRLKSLIFHSAQDNRIVNKKGDNMMGTLAYTKQKIRSPKDCHNNSELYFNVSLMLFSESLSFHTYFNRKVSIDVHGNIKNCTSHDRSFGNVYKDRIANVISKNDFQELWSVPKDRIVTCKDCEYRYMCNDTSAIRPVNKELWRLERECNYNPYIAKWKGDEGYLTIEQFEKIE